MPYTKDSAAWRVCLLALCMSTSFFYGQEKLGVAANCTWGHTVSDPQTLNPIYPYITPFKGVKE